MLAHLFLSDSRDFAPRRTPRLGHSGLLLKHIQRAASHRGFSWTVLGGGVVVNCVLRQVKMNQPSLGSV